MSWAQANDPKNHTNWIDQVIGHGFKQNYNLSTNYMGKNFAVKGILSMDDNGSFIIGNKYNRVSERINLDYRPIKGLNIQLSQ